MTLNQITAKNSNDHRCEWPKDQEVDVRTVMCIKNNRKLRGERSTYLSHHNLPYDYGDFPVMPVLSVLGARSSLAPGLRGFSTKPFKERAAVTSRPGINGRARSA